MIWLRLLMACRPVWQLTILVLYMYDAHLGWQKASFVIGGVVLICTNIILASSVEHPRWNHVRQRNLILESAVAGVLSVLMVLMWPMGPATLLLLPSLVTYAWLFERDAWQWMIALEILVIFLYRLHLLAVGWPTAAAHSHQLMQTLPYLVLVLYGAVLAFGAFLAFLLQIQKHESRQLQDTMKQVEEQTKQLARVNAQMTDYSNQVYELATAEERNRIAGEIHDTVAHRLTALFVQLQAARRILVQAGDVETVSENLQVCEALARESLDEVRHSVRAIRRSSDLESVDVLRRLAEHFAGLTGMEIQFQLDHDLGVISAQVIAVLYRVVQEGLTNAQRHGRASHVAIALKRDGPRLMLSLADNGKGCVVGGDGFGLASMRERVRGLGGDLEVASQPGHGFTLGLSVPV